MISHSFLPLVIIPVVVGAAYLKKGSRYRHVTLNIEKDALVYDDRKKSTRIPWEAIKEIRIHRASKGLVLWGSSSLRPEKFQIVTETGDFEFDQGLAHWQRLLDWIIFRSGLEAVSEPEEKGMDQIYRRCV